MFKKQIIIILTVVLFLLLVGFIGVKTVVNNNKEMPMTRGSIEIKTTFSAPEVEHTTETTPITSVEHTTDAIPTTEETNTTVCESTHIYIGTFEATAYANDTITSTGSMPIVGQTIAVDPDVIPYGTTVYIEAGNYSGYYIAEDCGGAINGNMIDIYMSTESECISWGRRDVEVYIMG